MKENNHLDIFSPFTWKSLYTYLILLVPFLNIFKKKIVSTLRTLPKPQTSELFEAKNTSWNRRMSSCGFSTHPSAVSDGRFLLGVATVLSLSVLLTWYGLRLQHPEAVSALWAGGPDVKSSFAESVGYGKDENWRFHAFKEAESLNSGWYFTILLLT